MALLASINRHISWTTEVRIDSGCTQPLIDQTFVKRLGISVTPLALPLEVEGRNNTVLDHIGGKVELHLTIGGDEETLLLSLVDNAEDRDCRSLNKFTFKDWYSLPLIQELIDKLPYTRVFTRLDICWGYNDVQIKEGYKWKATFRSNRGLLRPMVMAFGLGNSPSTFRWMMNGISHDFIDEDNFINESHIVVYLDDILIFTDGTEERRKQVHRVLQ